MVKLLSALLACLLVGCAQLAAPPPGPEPEPEPETESVSESVTESVPIRASRARSPDRWYASLQSAHALPAAARRRQIAELETLATPTPLQRFRLALLLEREGNLDQAARLIATLDRHQALVGMLQRLVAARIESREHSEKMSSLEGRLARLRALEKSMQQRSLPGVSP